MFVIGKSRVNIILLAISADKAGYSEAILAFVSKLKLAWHRSVVASFILLSRFSVLSEQHYSIVYR